MSERTDAPALPVSCSRCNGSGNVLIDLRAIGFGPGFYAYVTAGARPAVYGDDGSVKHWIVCPRCDNSGALPEGKTPNRKGESK